MSTNSHERIDLLTSLIPDNGASETLSQEEARILFREHNARIALAALEGFDVSTIPDNSTVSTLGNILAARSWRRKQQPQSDTLQTS